jgi:hypothetical protein
LGVETKKNGTHTRARAPKLVCKNADVTVLWNQGVHTDRQFMANMPDIIIEPKKESKRK